MRKTILTIISAFAILLSFSAAAQKKQKIEYEFPKEMPANVQEQYIQYIDKGLALYQITCAKCHSKFVKGKEIIPDFTAEQLEAYQIRISNAKHEAELQETTMGAEELSLITTFFTYKKKNEAIKTAKKK